MLAFGGLSVRAGLKARPTMMRKLLLGARFLVVVGVFELAISLRLEAED
jgi:hypothetical protein